MSERSAFPVRSGRFLGTARGRTALVLAAVAALIIGSVVMSDDPSGESTETTGSGSRDDASMSHASIVGEAAPDAAPAESAPPPEAGGGDRPGAGQTRPRPRADSKASPGAATPPPCDFADCNRAQGITDTTIKLGFYVLEGGDEAFAAFGVGASLGNEKRQAQILVDDINRRGGINGRKVVPFFVPQQAQSSDPPGDQKRACVAFAEDAKVFAVIPDGQLAGPEFRKCLADRRTLSISPAGRVTDAPEIEAQSPWGQLPNAKRIERVQRTLIPALQRMGYFGKWSPDGGPPRDASVGLVVADSPAYVRTADRVMKPLLARTGAKLADEYRVPDTGDPSQLQSHMSQAVLRFKSKGVTHVMMLPAISAFFFYQNAESQQFRPRYAVESYSFPSLMANLAPFQARGAMGIGWNPAFDVADPEFPYTDGEKRCFALMQKGGEDARNRGSRAIDFCDTVWLFEAAARQAGRTLTSAALLGGLRDVRAWDFRGFATDLAAGTADASYTHRLTAFEESCRCFRYRSGPLRDAA